MEIAYYLALMVASVLISTAMAPKPEPLKPASFDDFDFPQVDEGTAQCVVFGECWTGDWQVIGKGDFRTGPVRVKNPKK